MIILLDMTQNWNDDWVAKEDERHVGFRVLSHLLSHRTRPQVANIS